MTKPQDPIRINDKEFKFDELPLDAQTYIKAITGIDANLNSLAGQMDMFQMARKGYIDRLNTVIGDYENAVREQEERRVQEIANT